MKKFGTIIGLIGGFSAVLITLTIEGGHLSSLMNLGSFILIFIGSVSVTITCFGIETVIQIPTFIKTAVFHPDLDFKHEITTLLSFSEKARREGLLSLEDDMTNVTDEMTKTAMQMVIDGSEPENILTVLEDFSENTKKHDKIPAEVFETLGGFAPTLGIIGTVMGLVHVLESLGGDGGIKELGEGIASAFIATLYGIGFANLVWLPLSNNIKFLVHHQEIRRAIIITGVLGIQSGDNPRILKDKLLAQIGDAHERAKILKEINI